MIEWLALAVALFDLVLVAGAVVAIAFTYRKVKPAVSPFLSMLAPYAGAMPSSSSAASPSPPAEPSSSTEPAA